MHAGDSVLDPVNVQPALGQLDLLPLQVADLRGPQAVPIGDQHHGRVAMPVAAMLSGAVHQPLDLALGEVSPLDCQVYDAWCAFLGCRFHADKPSLRGNDCLAYTVNRPRRRLSSLPMRPYGHRPMEEYRVELDQGRMHVRRAKNGTPSVHPIRGDEIRALRKLRRESPNDAYVFVTERGGPMSTIGFHHLIQRLGKAARMPFPLHPHMLRHACGYKLANDGHDTRALQHYLGHKNIQHTVRYTELSPDRFRDFWRD